MNPFEQAFPSFDQNEMCDTTRQQLQAIQQPTISPQDLITIDGVEAPAEHFIRAGVISESELGIEADSSEQEFSDHQQETLLHEEEIETAQGTFEANIEASGVTDSQHFYQWVASQANSASVRQAVVKAVNGMNQGRLPDANDLLNMYEKYYQ
ncbi:hypothetical protein [Thalassotalea litorea]|uniref:hypothetical protein n=1 Tax=Thalassotalea litorea TaxID=2020715 RepID=UPI00373582C9